ncbi:hypothetical protein AB1Y20_022902 [Prymnesium parvum]|uniref:Calmodulin-lysine N-methyltransferase n=1 Tax=Prymnesium parvum TaxID=97485 RepID=A0AB34JF53_PRYPA
MAELPVREVQPTAAAAFLLRCARNPDRWFYPVNAKARGPVACTFRLCVAENAPVVEMNILECPYSDGGTGWRVWPCALMLTCWLATHASELFLQDLSVLEVGCGLGLPGLACAALGAASVDITDCLPRLLRCVSTSIAASHLEHRCRASLLDWDKEAPPEDVGAQPNEEFSTEQGVKAAQLAEARSAASQHGAGPGGPCSTQSIPSLATSTRYGLIVASDVIYSFMHASQLPLVISRRLAPRGRLCMILPVRDRGHATTFLRGLADRGLRVLLDRVDPDWTARVIALQAPTWKASVAALAAQPRKPEPFGESATLSEGDVLFVQATLPAEP